jgi:single-stranded-DNA-specific exonuclease
MIKYAKKNIKDEDLLPKLIIDLELQREKISINLFRSLEKLEPFGLGNSRPIFLTRNLRLISHRLVGKGDKHLQLKFTDGIAEYKGVVFNHDLDMKNISTGSEYDIVYQPGLNFWNGKNWIDLRIIDLKISEKL